MDQSALHDVALLVLRLGLAFLFLSAAIVHSKDAKGRWSARHFTSLLLGSGSTQSPLIAMVSVLAVTALYISGLGLLLGIEIRISAALVFLVAACGFVIHIRDGNEAFAVATALLSSLPQVAVQSLDRVKFSALVGNISSGIKNIPVMAAAVLLMIEGGGEYALSSMLAMPALW